ncbi:tRNA threonylcarbamoyladenosine biosynthesis protein TsaE [Thermodesulfobium acidiphilum]|uniref:tRNA threonylcarbamoyladenosine biosynthesis protein TsaE n=1 Tax=Thermodesulfobium acidiphilum TaxID=1794699 RepID=A0A2R4VYY2_THEAF|nr:tRNA (adenosine(37)-N6)-threonylcarbamoyltransferase complex ATPase subunit type 1 TsaE [Thermodesulfobium acidiphilum]AWB09650.1 tRNA threonylcarbamoyladenosine biosynthesis protein TsaE [Thermodesulfobium acidiphilum]
MLKFEGETFKVLIKDEKEMIKFGSKVGSCLEKGDVLLLEGKLGSGKTTFVRGIIKDAFSPSFTLLNKYNFKDTQIYHFDFYRLEKPDYDLFIELEEVEDAVVIVEWPKFDIPIFEKSTILKFIIFEDHREVIICGEKAREFYQSYSKK